MVKENKSLKIKFQELIFRASKATAKAVLLYGLYFIFSIFLSSVSKYVPEFQQFVENFVIGYLILMVVGEMFSGTIFHPFFNVAKSLFIIFYLIFSLNGGIIHVAFENINLTINIQLFIMVSVLLGLLGFAKSMLQTLNFLNKKVELSAR